MTGFGENGIITDSMPVIRGKPDGCEIKEKKEYRAEKE